MTYGETLCPVTLRNCKYDRLRWNSEDKWVRCCVINEKKIDKITVGKIPINEVEECTFDWESYDKKMGVTHPYLLKYSR